MAQSKNETSKFVSLISCDVSKLSISFVISIIFEWRKHLECAHTAIFRTHTGRPTKNRERTTARVLWTKAKKKRSIIAKFIHRTVVVLLIIYHLQSESVSFFRFQWCKNVQSKRDRESRLKNLKHGNRIISPRRDYDVAIVVNVDADDGDDETERKKKWYKTLNEVQTQIVYSIFRLPSIQPNRRRHRWRRRRHHHH